MNFEWLYGYIAGLIAAAVVSLLVALDKVSPWSMFGAALLAAAVLLAARGVVAVYDHIVRKGRGE